MNMLKMNIYNSQIELSAYICKTLSTTKCEVNVARFQIDEVIGQAQSTRVALANQRAFFGDVQGKVKQLGEKFPVIRGLLGNFLIPLCMLLNFVLVHPSLSVYDSLRCLIPIPLNRVFAPFGLVHRMILPILACRCH
jgi:hypothetical protein